MWAVGGFAIIFVAYTGIWNLHRSLSRSFDPNFETPMPSPADVTVIDSASPSASLTAEVTSLPLSNVWTMLNHSYQETYGHLVDSCPPNSTSLKECAAKLYHGPHNSNGTYPWWFQTLLRNVGTKYYAHASWHIQESYRPPVRMCIVEKIATKQWKEIFLKLNNQSGVFPRRPRPPPTVNDVSPPPSLVFLRDPLERFLSAYLDKCVNVHRRKTEKHCEPKELFVDREAHEMLHGLDGNGDGDREKRRMLFDAYVDVMPLKWNLHFLPQSVYCDGLFRTLGGYDFVGNMGPGFYLDLDMAARRFGGRFADAVRWRFRLSDDKTNKTKSNDNKGVETSAPAHVYEYYTPRSVRRVLEYLSIDYIHLGLPIPEWANQMLQQAIVA